MSLGLAWAWLLAIVFEVAGTLCMKLSEGFSNWLPTIMILPLYIASFSALVMALKRIELGVAYAVWSALGTLLVVALGVLLFREGLGLLKLGGMALIVVGVVMLHLASPGAR